MMALRLDEGMDPARYRSLAGRPISEATLRHLTGIGMIELNGPRVRATSEGRMLLNSVIAALAEE